VLCAGIALVVGRQIAGGVMGAASWEVGGAWLVGCLVAPGLVSRCGECLVSERWG